MNKRFFKLLSLSIKRFFQSKPLEAFPMKGVVSRYNRDRLWPDAKAAINVSLLALPQGMAYAAIAGLPIVNGIVCSAIAALVSPFFAGSRHTILGPTNATSFMLFSFFATAEQLNMSELVPLIVLLVGILCFIGALLKVADLLQYVSRSVLVGYITGAAVLIIANQLKHVLGIDASGRTFVFLISDMWEKLGTTLWQPLTIGIATLLLYLFLQKKFRKLPNFAIALIIISVAVLLLGRHAPDLGFQNLSFFKGFELADLAPKLPTLGQFGNLYEALSELLLVSFAIAFLATLENSVMSKTLASQTGDSADVNQDMLAVGASNLACSCLAGMPASGSLTRSALNYSSGAITRFSSIICGIICVIGVVLLAKFPLVTYIPKSCLAALVIGIAISLINFETIRICLRSTKGDAAVLIITFICALIAPLYVAIFIGVALSIILFLRKASQPHLVEYAINEEGGLRELGENENLKVIVLRLKNARHLDDTSVLALSDLIDYARIRDRHIIISGATRPVYRVLKSSGVLDVLQDGCDKEKGQSNIFMNSPSNPNIATRDALKRAQEVLGTDKADIQIFYDPNKDQS